MWPSPNVTRPRTRCTWILPRALTQSFFVQYTKRVMEVDAERTLHNLHVLSAVSPYDKLITSGDAFDIHGPTRLRELYRTWSGERRTQNMNRVRQTVRAAITYVNKSLDDANALLTSASRTEESMKLRVDTIVVQHVRMCEGLKQSRSGLKNLLQTYRDDAMLMTQLHLTITEINDFLSLIYKHTEKIRLQCSSVVFSNPCSPPVSCPSSPRVDFSETPES